MLYTQLYSHVKKIAFGPYLKQNIQASSGTSKEHLTVY